MDETNSKTSNPSGKSEIEIKIEKEFQPSNNILNKKTEETFIKKNKFEMKNTVLDNFINQSLINGEPNKNIRKSLFINNFKSSLIISKEEMNELINNLKYNGFIKTNNNISNENSFLQSSKINIKNFDSYIKKFTYNDALQFANSILELEYNLNESNINMAIHPLIKIYIMIEESFNNDKKQKKKMEEKNKLLKDYKYYRKIKGDGNCFYRAIIFKYLELIIFNKEIDLLKNIILDVDKCFKNDKIKQKLNIGTLDAINPILVKKILISIYFFLTQNDIKNAYKLFYKSINMSKRFDMGLVLYFRYTIFQYIEENQNKLYTENFPIQIGNLLPGEYETDDGKFLFNTFYDNYLLKLFNDAEKIVIYLTPFIFPIQLNIILYEDNSNNFIQEYCSPQNINCKNIINVIYNKEHFELLYSNKEYVNFKEYLFEYVNNDKSSKFLEYGDIIDEDIEENIDKITVNDKVSIYNSNIQVDLNQNLKRSEIILNSDNIGIICQTSNPKKNIKIKFENENENDKEQPLDNSQISLDSKNEEVKNESKSVKSDDKIGNDNYDIFNKLNESEIFLNKTTMESPIYVGPFNERKCSKCQSIQDEFIPTTQFTVCNKCFKKELIKEFERKYFSFISQIKKYVLSKKTKNYYNMYEEKFYPFMDTGFKICNVVFTIGNLKKFSYNFEQFLILIKKKKCLNCQKNFKNNNVIQIPCNCVFCGIRCLREFFSKYVNLNNKNLNDISCLCCINYSFFLISKLRTVFLENKLNDLAIKVTSMLNKRLAMNCAKCDLYFNEIKPIPISYRNYDTESKLNPENLEPKYNLYHFLCPNCFKEFNKVTKVKEKKELSFKCVFCKKIHLNIKKK